MDSKVRRRNTKDQYAVARKAKTQKQKNARDEARRVKAEEQDAHSRAVRKSQLIFYFACFICLLGTSASSVPLLIKLLDKCYFSAFVSKFYQRTTKVKIKLKIQELKECERSYDIQHFHPPPSTTVTRNVKGQHYFNIFNFEFGWLQANHYELTDTIPQWTTHTKYPLKLESLTTRDTSSVYEFGRYCNRNYIIRVEIDDMLIHCATDVVAQFKYTRMNIESIFQFCGQIGNNYWDKKINP